MGRVLMVSKPVVPPWNDSSKNLARALAGAMRRHEAAVMTDGADPGLPARVCREPIYADAGRYQPGLAAQLTVLRRLALGRRSDLWHFFFAPNPKSSAAGRALSLVRRRPTVQTICSRPRDPSRAKRLLFADKSVVVSRASRVQLLDAGIAPDRLVHVPPAVPRLEPPSEQARREARAHFGLPADAPVVVYPGDLEHSRGAQRSLRAFAASARDDAWLVMACRDKTSRAREAERALRDEAAELGERVRWIGETDRIHDLLGAADVVALPATDLYAKMDLPLVLLEAMFLGRAVLVVEDSPAAELASHGGALATAPDAEAIGAGLEDLLENDGAREALGEAARRVADERYSPEAMARAYEDLYDELL